jgi:hypothetical protein
MSDNTQTSQFILEAQTIDEIRAYAKALIQARIVVILEGAPGAGKTDFSRQLAKELDHEFLSIVTSGIDYAIVSGIPDLSGDTAIFKPFGMFDKIYKADKPLLVLFDDLGQTVPQVQSAIQQLIHDGELNGHKVPSCVKFMIATNRRKDKAGVHGIISPIRSRATTISFVSKCTCTRDKYCSWHRWAIDTNIHPAVAAFAQFRPYAMSEYDENVVDRDGAVCCARTLEYLSRLENNGLPTPHKEIIEITIGKRYAAEYLAFRGLYLSMPMYSDIVSDPESCYVPGPEKLSERIAITTMLVHMAQEADTGAIITYISRMGMELSTACITTLEKKFPSMTQTKSYIAWALENAKNINVKNK